MDGEQAMGCAPSAGSKSPAGVMVYCNQRGNTVAEMDSDIGTHHRMSLSEELIIINSKVCSAIGHVKRNVRLVVLYLTFEPFLICNPKSSVCSSFSVALVVVQSIKVGVLMSF